MLKILIYLVAFWASFLPPRYRKRFDLENTREMRPATILSGLAQSAVFASLDVALPGPMNVILVYFAMEGWFRAAVAVATHESLGTLPLHVLARFHDASDAKKHKKGLNPLVADNFSLPSIQRTTSVC